jgi:hypothetical protein
MHNEDRLIIFPDCCVANLFFESSFVAERSYYFLKNPITLDSASLSVKFHSCITHLFEECQVFGKNDARKSNAFDFHAKVIQ